MTWSAFLQKLNCFQLGRAPRSARRAERLTIPDGFLKGALHARPAIENALQTGAPPFKKAFGGHGPLVGQPARASGQQPAASSQRLACRRSQPADTSQASLPVITSYDCHTIVLNHTKMLK